MVPFRLAASPPTRGPSSTSRQPRPSTAPSPAPSKIRWTISSARSMRQAWPWRPAAALAMTSRPCVRAVLLSPAPVPTPRVRSLSWISMTRCVSPCRLPVVVVVPRWAPWISVILMWSSSSRPSGKMAACASSTSPCSSPKTSSRRWRRMLPGRLSSPTPPKR